MAETDRRAARRAFAQPRPRKPDENGKAEGVDLSAQTEPYMAATSTEAAKTGYWVDYPGAQYRDKDGNPLRILYRTGNRTKVRQSRPEFLEPYDLRNKRRALERLQRAQSEDPLNDELDKQWEELRSEIIKEQTEYEDGYHREQAKWLANFVLDIQPWPFTDIKSPNPDDPESYVVLYTELEDLYVWCINHGYPRALEASAKNS